MEQINNECKIKKNQIIIISNIFNVSKGTCKIEVTKNEDTYISSGFLLKLKRNQKPFYSLMTNSHCIFTQKKNMETEKDDIKLIKIKYDNEKSELAFKLIKYERIILDFQESNIDIAIIEIIPKDKIDDSFFLSPQSNINEDEITNKVIQVIQYPDGKDLAFSEGKITGKAKKNFPYLFFHEASTKFGSSGSPIVLKGEEKIIGIHRGSVQGKMKNAGILIGAVVKAVNEYKKNGYGIEYYENGDLKYEGNFLDDEYDGDGKFIDEKKQTYLGTFKKGKKNGDFIIVKGENDITECKFKDDELIGKKNSNNKSDNKKEKNETKKPEKNKSLKNVCTMIVNELYHSLKPVGDSINFKCGCRHVSKSHTELERGKWKCSECNSICSLTLDCFDDD